MNNSIKAVIFDVGGVLVRTYDQSGRRLWENRLGLPPGGAEAVVLNSEMGHRAQRGEISTEALWQWVAEHLNLGNDLPTFRQDFWRGDYADKILIDFMHNLKRYYRLAVISNATDDLLVTLEGYQLLRLFDIIVASAFEGIMKPNPVIYERTLNRLNLAPEETVFIDDAVANVLTAREVGMHAVHFTSDVDLRSELALLGIRIAD